MYKIIAICGEAGSGKDRTLRELYLADQERFVPQFHKIINCTTRPPREGEIDGVNYHYLTPEDFAQRVIDGTMIEATEHRGWFYGTDIRDLVEDKINIGVFNPIALDILADEPRVAMRVYRIAATPKNRMLRQLNREEDPDVDEIVRRYGTDKRDFAELETPYELLENNSENDLWSNVVYISQHASLGNFD